jgi:hypothetical protein
MSTLSHGVSHSISGVSKPMHFPDPLTQTEKLVTKFQQSQAAQAQAQKELQEQIARNQAAQMQKAEALKNDAIALQGSLATHQQRLIEAQKTLNILSHTAPPPAYSTIFPGQLPSYASLYPAPPYSPPIHPIQQVQGKPQPIHITLPANLLPKQASPSPVYPVAPQASTELLDTELSSTLRSRSPRVSSSHIGELNFSIKQFDPMLGYAPNPDLLKPPFVKGGLGGHRDKMVTDLSRLASKAKDAYEQKDAEALNKLRKQINGFNPFTMRWGVQNYLPIPGARGHFRPYRQNPEDYRTIRYYKEDVLTYVQDALRELDTSRIESFEGKKHRHYSDQHETLKAKLESSAQDILDDFERTRDKQIAEKRLNGLEKATKQQLNYLLDYVLGTMSRTTDRERLKSQIENHRDLLPELYDVKVALGLKAPITQHPEKRVAAAYATLTAAPVAALGYFFNMPYAWPAALAVGGISYGSRVSKAGAEMVRQARDFNLEGVARNLVELITGVETKAHDRYDKKIIQDSKDKEAEDETKTLQAKFKSGTNWKKTADARKELIKSLQHSKVFDLKGAGKNEIDSLIKVLKADKPPEGVNVFDRLDKTTRKLFKDSQQTSLWKALEEDSKKLLNDYVEAGFTDETEAAINERIEKFPKTERDTADSAVNFANAGTMKQLLYTDLYGNTPVTRAGDISRDLKALTAYKKSLVELGNQYAMLREDLQNNL